MEEITVFLCDIVGTYTTQNASDHEAEIQRFLSNLEKLRIANGGKKMLFSFVSGENREVVYAHYSHLRELNKNPLIIFGPQFFDRGYFLEDKVIESQNVDGKLSQITAYLDELTDKCKVTRVYFADDTKFYHDLLEDLIEANLVSIVPLEDEGLSHVNEFIEETLKNKLEPYNAGIKF